MSMFPKYCFRQWTFDYLLDLYLDVSRGHMNEACNETPTRPIHIYIYIYMCVCVCVYVIKQRINVRKYS